ncbi:hypothetical protein BCY75_04300 [Latilactobacillus curvatus]|uniref:oligosaccharide flippase family protein n=1 Tax=Latilactobacillus curvatus TaxID=28038 RepID=UPI0008153855|nr:oligosaccharide flippase family protein [Latilactobacillus curvatus]ANY13253.1 hypothetical protein BCY75_04300 [Latilactobacillus curvatus]
MKKTLNNIIYNGIYQLLILALPIITVPYVARVLGARALGSYSFITSISMFLSFVILMGMNQLGSRIIAQSHKDKGELGSNFVQLWKIQFLVGCLVILAYTFFAMFSEYKTYLLLNIPYLIGFAIDISWVFIGLGEVRKVVVRNTLIKICSVAMIFIFVKKPSDLGYYVLINSLSIFFANIIFWLNLKGIITKVSFKGFFSKSIFLKEAMILVIPQLAVQFYTNFDSTLVGWIAGPVQLTYYDQSQRIARMLVTLITSVSTILMPRMVQLRMNHANNEKVDQLLKTSLDYTLLAAQLFTMLLMVNASEFVPWFYGKSYTLMTNNMLWVGLIMIFISYGEVFGSQFSLVNGDYKQYAIPAIVGAVISVILNVICVNIWGADGGTAVIILTEFIVCSMRIYMVRKEADLRYLVHEQLRYVLAFLMTVLAVLNFKIVLPSLFLTMVVNSIIVTIVYVLLLVLLRTRINRDIVRLVKKVTR